jgi:hypothetical protein
VGHGHWALHHHTHRVRQAPSGSGSRVIHHHLTLKRCQCCRAVWSQLSEWCLSVLWTPTGLVRCVGSASGPLPTLPCTPRQMRGELPPAYVLGWPACLTVRGCSNPSWGLVCGLDTTLCLHLGNLCLPVCSLISASSLVRECIN